MLLGSTLRESYVYYDIATILFNELLIRILNSHLRDDYLGMRETQVIGCWALSPPPRRDSYPARTHRLLRRKYYRDCHARRQHREVGRRRDLNRCYGDLEVVSHGPRMSSRAHHISYVRVGTLKNSPRMKITH